jgi:GNAT superfamily N-acetyltransferase
MTSIVEATRRDISVIVAKALDFNASTAYAALIVFEPDRLARVAGQLIDSDNGVVFLAVREDSVIGMLAAAMQEHPLSGEHIVNEMVWWVDPGERGGRAALRLMTRAEAWGGVRGATTFQMVAPDDRTGAFYMKLGFTKVETLYQRTIVQQRRVA